MRYGHSSIVGRVFRWWSQGSIHRIVQTRAGNEAVLQCSNANDCVGQFASCFLPARATTFPLKQPGGSLIILVSHVNDAPSFSLIQHTNADQSVPRPIATGESGEGMKPSVRTFLFGSRIAYVWSVSSVSSTNSPIRSSPPEMK